jgi:endonuclease/exonuclease/phosphatase family metal-dependent hydrolase
VREVSEEDVALLVVEEITAADLSDMERSGIDELLPHRIGEPKSFGDGTMVFSRDALGTPERIATLHDSWVVEVGDLTVVAVHPYAPTQPWAWRQDHDRIASAVAAAEPDLVLGDFNATADHAPMRALSDAGYRDAGELTNAGWQPTWPSSGVARLLGLTLPPVAQIDHVLVGPRLAALSARTIDVPGSDHRAVLAQVARK